MSVQPSFVDPEPVVEIQRPIVLRFQGMTPRNLWRFRMHDKRRGGDLSHVDPEMTRKNEVLFGDEDWIPRLLAEVDQVRQSNLDEHIAVLRAKSRQKEADEVALRGLTDPWRASDYGPLREGILTVNKAWFGGTAYDRWDPDRVTQFRDRALGFLQQHFPEGQLRYASGHSDEEAYHIHFVVTVWTEKHSANRGQQFLLQPSLNPLLARYEHAQDLAGEAFADLGITRGEKRAEAIRRAKAAGAEVPKPRRHIPPSTHRTIERLQSHIHAAKMREKAEADSRRIVAGAESHADQLRRRAQKVEEGAVLRAELVRRDAIADRQAILDEAKDLGTAVIRKSRKRAIREAKARKAEIAGLEKQLLEQGREMRITQARREGRAAADMLRRGVALKAEQRRSEAAAEKARQAVSEAGDMVAGYEARAEQEIQRMEGAKAGRQAAEQARDRAREDADAEAARQKEAARLRGAEEAVLRDLKDRCRAEDARLQHLSAEADRAELRMYTAVIGAEAVEQGLDLIAQDVLRATGDEAKPGLDWGEAAPPAPAARIRLLEAVRPAEPMLLRITRAVMRVVRQFLLANGASWRMMPRSSSGRTRLER